MEKTVVVMASIVPSVFIFETRRRLGHLEQETDCAEVVEERVVGVIGGCVVVVVGGGVVVVVLVEGVLVVVVRGAAVVVVVVVVVVGWASEEGEVVVVGQSSMRESGPVTSCTSVTLSTVDASSSQDRTCE